MLVYCMHILLYDSGGLKHCHLILFNAALNVVNVDLADIFHWGSTHI